MVRFLAFVVDADPSKAKIYVTVLDKRTLTADVILCTAVIPLKLVRPMSTGDCTLRAEFFVTSAIGIGVLLPVFLQDTLNFATFLSFRDEQVPVNAPKAETVTVKLSDPDTGDPTAVTIVAGLRVVPKAVGFGWAPARQKIDPENNSGALRL